MGKLFTKPPKLNRNQFCFFLLLTLNLSFLLPARAGNPPVIKWTAKNAFEQKVFIENKGQFELPEKNIDSKSILFGARQDGLLYYFTKDGIWIVREATVKLTHHDKEQLEHQREELIKQYGQKGAKDDDDDDENSFKVVKEYHQLNFIGANPSAVIISDDEVSQLYNFSINSSAPVQTHAFKKITYKNLYPGIDMDFYFPDDKQGFKYVFIVHPGADVSAIKIQYPLDKSVTLNIEGNIVMESVFGEFTDNAPLASQTIAAKPISCSFALKQNTVQFNIGDYDKNQVLVIDPWTITPVFTNNNDAYDVDYDNAGNCYVYGGTAPYQVLKFNNAGTQLWSYTETFTSGYPYYGGFAVDRVSQSVYIIDGYNPNTGTQIIKLNSSGAQVTVFQGNPSFTEMWRIAFSRCANEPVITGGGITDPSFEASYLDTSLTTLSPVNVLGTNMPHHDIWGLTFDDFGNCYMASMETEPGIVDTTFNNRLLKLPLPSLSPTTWMVNDGYKFREISSTKYTSYIANGFNGMTVSNTHLYTYDSYVLKQWNTANGALMNTLNINGASQVKMDWAGLTSDNCDNIFVGSKKNILQYNSGLALVNSTAMPDSVHDLIISKKKVLYACGKNFVYAIQENLPACFTATNNITNPSCSLTTGSVIITPMGGNAPYTVTWNTTPQQSGDTLTNLLQGKYIATIIDNSCPRDTVYDTVTIVSTSTFTITVNSPSICDGNSAVLNALGGATLYTWSPSNGLSATTGSSVTANPTITTTYSVIGIAAGGCVDTVQAVVTVNPSPAITVVAPAPICSGSSTTITANGASSYTWTPSTGLSATSGSSVIASPTITTTYTVTGTNASGCSGTTTVVVTVNHGPVITIATPAPICSGNSAMLTANGAPNYTWTPSTGLSTTSGSSVSASPTTTTTYTITGTNASGCTGTTTVVVTVNQNPTITVASPAPICNGSSTTLTANGATSYTWSPATGLSSISGSTVTANPTTTTTYTITGTNGSGCTDTTKVVVTINPDLTIVIATPAPICIGSSATLTANGATSYAWSPSTGLSATSGSSVTANPTVTTTYTITGTNGSGCTGTTTVVVTVNPNPTIIVASPAPICNGSSTTLTANGATSYIWSPSTRLSATSGSLVTADPTTTTTYTVTGTNGSGCTDTTTVVVTINPNLTIVIATPAPICIGGSATLIANGAATYAWTPSIALSATSGSSVTANPTITTTYTITGTNASGCTGTTTVVVTVNPNPTITIVNPAPICVGNSAALTANGATSYTWIPATGLSATSGSSVTANPTITTTYTISGTNGSGCTGATTVVVTVNPNPVIAVTIPTPICDGSSATLTASGATNYTWTPSVGLNATSGSNVTANPTTTTTYIITGTNGSGCSGATTVVVVVNPNPTIIVATPAPICNGSSTTLTANGATNCTWAPSIGLSSTTGSSVTANPNATTTYSITGTNASGCIGTTTVAVTVNPNPVITVATPAPICNGSSITLTANGATSYTWTPSTGLSATSGSSVTANPTVTTTYTVTGTNGSDCTDTTTVVVNVNPNPIIIASSPAPICVGGSATFIVNGAINYTWTPATGLSTSTGSTVTANPTTTTTYTITGTNADGCASTSPVVVTVNPNPTITVATPAPICNGNILTLTVNGGTSYTWTPATGLNTTSGSIVSANPTTTTTYTIVGTNSNGCSVTTIVAVIVNPNPTITVATPAPICNGSNTPLTANGATSYIWTPATGLNTTSGSTVIANPNTTSTYTITGTNGSGCSATTTAVVTVNPNPTITVTTPAPICSGSSTTLTANGSTPYISYIWTPVVGLSPTAGSSVIADPITSTTYTITGTDTNGCVANATVSVKVNPNPIITVTTPSPICVGNSSTLTASGAASYIWTPSTGLNTTNDSLVTANPTATTTYTVTGTSASGCIGTTTTVVTVNPNPTITVAPPAPICSGSSTTLTANGAATYTWTPAAGLSSPNGSPVTANPATTTTYTIIGTNASGCTGTTTVVVAINPNTTVVVSTPAPICSGDSTALTANGAVSYTWSPAKGLNTTNGSSVIATPATTTTYSIVGINNSGCIGTTTVTVMVNPTPTISVPTPAPICTGNSALLLATGTTSYTWTPVKGLSAASGSSVISTPTTTTTYTITGTSVSGCSATTTVVVTVNPNPVITVTAPAPMCSGNGTTLNASGATSYTWIPSVGLNATSGSSVTANPTVTTTYTITGTNGSGCTSTTQSKVTIYPDPRITLPPPVPFCIGDSATLTAQGAATYLWSPATGLNTISGSTVTAKPSVNKTYTVTGTDSNGCMGTATVMVIVNPNPNISANTPHPVCKGNSQQLIASGATYYSWSPAVGLTATTGSSVMANPVDTTTYTVTGTNDNGCSAQAQIQLDVMPLPVVSVFGLNPNYCVNSPAVTLVGSPQGGTFYGKGVDSNQFSPTLAGGAGTYLIKYNYTDSNGCKDSSSTDVYVAPLPKIYVSPNNPTICSGVPVTLTVSGASTYIWSPTTGLSDSTASDETVDPTVTTTYVITGTSAYGCTDTAMVTVNVDSMPEAMFNAQPANYCDPLTMQFANNSSGGNSYNWDFGDGSSSTDFSTQHTYRQSGTYQVRLTATSPHGCANDIVKDVTIHTADNDAVMIGDAFTPNGDGINDVIAPKVLCQSLSGYVFRVYNRWGQLLFESFDPNAGWDGKFNGQMEPLGVYDYYIEFSCGDCKIFKKGNISLLK